MSKSDLDALLCAVEQAIDSPTGSLASGTGPYVPRPPPTSSQRATPASVSDDESRTRNPKHRFAIEPSLADVGGNGDDNDMAGNENGNANGGGGGGVAPAGGAGGSRGHKPAEDVLAPLPMLSAEPILGPPPHGVTCSAPPPQNRHHAPELVLDDDFEAQLDALMASPTAPVAATAAGTGSQTASAEAVGDAATRPAREGQSKTGAAVASVAAGGRHGTQSASAAAGATAALASGALQQAHRGTTTTNGMSSGTDKSSSHKTRAVGATGPAAAIPSHGSSMHRTVSLDATARRKCGPVVFLGGSGDKKGLSSSYVSRCACSSLRCTSCDFTVVCIDHRKWNEAVDYMFFRNNMPNMERLLPMLEDAPEFSAYACQCSWTSVSELQKVNSTQLRWVCAGHSVSTL